MLNMNELKFDAHGLIPAIVVDAQSKKVLTLEGGGASNLKQLIVKAGICPQMAGRACFLHSNHQSIPVAVRMR